jgi:putative hemolysin
MEEISLFFQSLRIDTEHLELTLRVCLQVVLLLSSAVFSGSETAMFSLSRIDLQKLRNTRNRHSESIHAMLDEPRRLIISILCGNELVNIASSANMAAILLVLFGAEDAGWINILVMVPMLLLVGEVTPKTIAVSHPVGYSTAISARVLPKWIYFVTPLREAVRLVADRVTTLIVGEVVDRENILRPDEFKTILEESEETGVIQATERVLIDNVLEASETEISHIMTPGPRIRFLDADVEFAESLTIFREFRHPRVPVYSGHWDNVIGFLHSEDVLRLKRSGIDMEKMALKDILRPAYFVPPTTKVDEMFNFFQEHNCRAAIVLGEFGEVLGIVTIKDALTFLFGEITGKMKGSEDWHEDEEGYIVPGDMRLMDFHVFTNVDISDPVMTTIGGVVFRLFGRLPNIGDKVTYEGYEFRVLEMNGLRISKLRLQKAGQISEGDAQEEKPPEATIDEAPHASEAGTEETPANAPEQTPDAAPAPAEEPRR